MKIAVTGPVGKDVIYVDNEVVREGVGGSSYYEAHVLKLLGVDIKVFGTYDKKDEALIKKAFVGIDFVSIYGKNTITHELYYKSESPNFRITKVPEYGANTFPTDDSLLDELKTFDYIFLGPLYVENLSHEFFIKMQGSNLVINNFGLFSHFENGSLVWKEPENVTRAAPFLKYLFLDESEAKFAAQKENIDEAGKYFLDLGTGTVVITRGSKGSVVFTKYKKYNIPAYSPKKLVDPTGAGDTYLAGFIFATELFPDDIQKQGEFAAMTATMAIEKSGAFSGTLEEVLSRLKSERARAR